MFPFICGVYIMTLNSIPYSIPIGRYRYRGLNLLCNKDKSDWHVFSVLEKMEQDMQDYNDKPQFVFANGSGGKKYKMIFVSCDFELTSEFLANPSMIISLDSGRGAFSLFNFNTTFLQVPQNSSYYTLDNIHEKGIGRILPKREGPAFVKSYIDNDRKVVEVINEESFLRKQIKELSEKFFGIDLWEFREHVGNRYLLWHDEDFKAFHIKSNNSPNGILLDVIYRSHVNRPFKMRITDKQQVDCTVLDCIWDVPAGARSVFIPLENFPSLCGIYFYSEDGRLLYYTKECGFVTQIAQRIGVCEKAVSVKVKEQDGSERTLEPVNKFTYIDSFIGGSCNDSSNYFARNETFHRIKELEKNRDFLFFDGSKTEAEKKANKQKAKEAVLDVMNRAHEVCYICDPYFNPNDFIDYITQTENLNVKFRIINSKADVKNEIQVNLNDMISQYNNEVGKDDHVECRVLLGDNSRLHDRFIVVDNQVWYMGASFSEFGARACSFALLSESAALCVKTYIEEWWRSDDITTPISEIKVTNQKGTCLIRKKIIKNLKQVVKYLEEL